MSVNLHIERIIVNGKLITEKILILNNKSK